MRENNRKPIEKCRKKLPQFTTMNVIDGQAGLVSYFSLIFYSLTIDNILNIIVLLILAGVTIATLMGDNGILTKATEAKEEQADGTVKEAMALLWNEYQLEIKSSSNEGVKESTKIASTEITKIQGEEKNYLAITATNFWDFLLTDKQVINADGIVNVQKLTGQTLDRGNGTDGVTDVYKIERNEETNEYTLKYCVKAGEEESIWNVTETSTSGGTSEVNIVISKTPENEPSGGVLLKVEEVQGLENVDLNSINVDELEENEKKDLIKKADIYINNNFNKTNVQDFNEVLEEFFDGVEQKYWDAIGDIDSYLKDCIDRLIESGMESLPSYTIINQDGEVSDTYIVFANGTYVFTVRDIVTGEIYEKTVDVTNINTSLEYYYIDTYGGRAIYLNNKDNNPVEFQNAYIIFKGERIDITPCIEEDNIIDMLATGNFLESIGKIENWHAELFNTKQIFEIVKDGESYFCEVLIYWSEV